MVLCKGPPVVLRTFRWDLAAESIVCAIKSSSVSSSQSSISLSDLLLYTPKPQTPNPKPQTPNPGEERLRGWPCRQSGPCAYRSMARQRAQGRLVLSISSRLSRSSHGLSPPSLPPSGLQLRLEPAWGALEASRHGWVCGNRAMLGLQSERARHVNICFHYSAATPLLCCRF